MRIIIFLILNLIFLVIFTGGFAAASEEAGHRFEFEFVIDEEGNVILQLRDGDGLLPFVSQDGKANYFIRVEKGEDNYSWIFQEGQENFIFNSQIGESNQAQVSQTGEGNQVIIKQSTGQNPEQNKDIEE